MRQNLLSALLTLLLICMGLNSSGQEKKNEKIIFTPGVNIGYNRGFGLQANITASNFAKEFPFDLRLGIGYSFINPGDALDARRIFINNNTNGVPEKKGRSLDIRLDFLAGKTIFGINPSYLVFGPRFSTFKGNFVYVGGNEDFDVTSHQWGVGIGIEHHFKMSENFSLVMSYGADYYIPSTLTGHDTSYSPDNDNRNPKRDNQNNDVYFIYKDANEAIKQPGFMPRLMLGVTFGF